MHPHMGPQYDIPGKPDEEVLATCVHPLDGSAANREVVVSARDSGEYRFETRDPAARERLIECARGTQDRVTFGHQEIPNPKSQIPSSKPPAYRPWDLGFGI